MRNLASIVLTGLFLSFGAHGVEPHSIPIKDIVPNEETAIQIAVAIWIPIYGKENIERQKPYKARLENGVWHVTGNLLKKTVGGVAIAEIQEADAKVLLVSHGK